MEKHEWKGWRRVRLRVSGAPEREYFEWSCTCGFAITCDTRERPADTCEGLRAWVRRASSPWPGGTA